jgi:hypothetical protein
MAAATAERKTTRLGESLGDSPAKLGLKAATKVFKGTLVVNDAGVMAPGRAATGLVALGVAIDTYDNTAGAANAMLGEAETGSFAFNNSASGDLITVADIGSDCFIVDDTTVAKTNGSSTRSRAGKVVDIDAEGVFVRVGPGYLGEGEC